LPEQTNQLGREGDSEQRREHRKSEVAKLTQQCALKNHFAN